jgi:hypothetical protein
MEASDEFIHLIERVKVDVNTTTDFDGIHAAEKKAFDKQKLITLFQVTMKTLQKIVDGKELIHHHEYGSERLIGILSRHYHFLAITNVDPVSVIVLEIEFCHLMILLVKMPVSPGGQACAF